MSESFRLKNGETLTYRIIDDPDDDDVPKLMSLLGHKGGLWEYHFQQWREKEARKLNTRFYVGSIDNEQVANIMVVSYRGIGLMGHVFTSPDHRRKGICDVLMDLHMEDFRERGGDVVLLNTGFESAPYRIYERHGYLAVPGRPGSMWWSPKYTEVDQVWSGVYSSLDRADVADLGWQHWPSMNVFSHLPVDQIVRSTTYGLYGVSAAEGPYLSMKHESATMDGVQTRIVETGEGHVCGLATLAPERRWGNRNVTWVFDLFVHPEAEDEAPDLIDDFEWPDAHVLSYAAETDTHMIDLLADAGFRPHSHVERFFEGDIGLVVMDRE